MKEKIIPIAIEQITRKGKGLGFFNQSPGTQQKVEVPYTSIGDKVEVTIKNKKNGVFPVRLFQFIQEKPNKAIPRCTHFGICGGCSWQHIPYQEQLLIKEDFVRTDFKALLSYDTQLLPILAAQASYGYRNKMEFSFSQDLKNEKFLGLLLPERRGKVLDLKECHLTSPWFVETLHQVKLWWENSSLRAYHPPSNQGSLRTLILRESATTKEKLVMLTVSGNPEFALHKSDIESFIALFNQTSLFLRIQQAIKGQPTEFYEMHLAGQDCIHETLEISIKNKIAKLQFSISPSAFFQPNTKQAELLYTRALELAALSSEDIVYDLFCGTGTIGLLAASFVKQVIGIELSAESSLDARMNAKRNHIENIEILTGSVGDTLIKNPFLPKPSVIFLDPPRSGIEPKTLEEIVALKAKKIVYISCNPQTQARDITLLNESGYQLQLIQPVDQFPQTPHIENIVLLIKHSYEI